MSYEEIEEQLTKGGNNSYPAKVLFLKQLLDNCPSYSLNYMMVLHEKTISQLDVREAILAEDEYFKDLKTK